MPVGGSMPVITRRTSAAKRRALPSYKETILGILPDQGGWSDEAYLWLTDNTNRLVELTDGVRCSRSRQTSGECHGANPNSGEFGYGFRERHHVRTLHRSRPQGHAVGPR